MKSVKSVRRESEQLTNREFTALKRAPWTTRSYRPFEIDLKKLIFSQSVSEATNLKL